MTTKPGRRWAATAAATLTALLAAATLGPGATAATPAVLSAPAPAAAGCPAGDAGKTLRSAPGSGKTVALTIDDTRPEYIEAFIEMLQLHGVRATFFNTGEYDAQMKASVKKAASHGHLINPHTWDHQYPTAANGYWKPAWLTDQIQRGAAQQEAITGKKPCFFRPPGGNMNNVAAVTKSLGLATVLWGVDSQDWAQTPTLTTKATADIVTKATDLRYAPDKNHPVVLIHAGKASKEPESQVTSNRSNTLAALPQIIAWYKDRGYTFVAMDGSKGVPAAPAPKTGEALKSAYGSLTLQLGDAGFAVRDLQVELNRRGFNAGTPDGVFDATVQSAVKAFEKKAGTYVNGTVTSADWTALAKPDTPPVKNTTRLAGADRYATAAAVAGQFPAGVEVAYVASGADFPDALAAAALAGSRNAPVLLTRPTAVPAPVAKELSRLRPKKIVVVGGSSGVSAQVATALKRYATTGAVTRLAGADRYATAAQVAEQFGAGVQVAYVASGANFPDALSGAALAGSQGAPVLLTRPGAVPVAVTAQLARLKPERIVVLGSQGAVSASVATELARHAPVTRLAGADRYATAAQVAAQFGANTPVVYVATGAGYPDALAGAALAGAKKAPVLLTRPGSVPGPAATQLSRLRPGTVVVLGGEVSVSAATLAALDTYTR
jgi:putative cell wall-binding protein/peptidoglycan/xylan/chitin deacetylase (PgdA/CDA1 family)